MLKVDEIKVLKLDDHAFVVDELSPSIQEKVAIYNKWNQEELDLKLELIKVSKAKNDLSREIIAALQEERAAQEKAEVEAVEENTETVSH